MQVYENSPYRGYLSTVDNKAFFGLDSIKTLDSVVLEWYSGKKQVIQNVRSNQLLKVDIVNANTLIKVDGAVVANNLFTDVTSHWA